MTKGVCVLLDANFEQGGEMLAIQLSNAPQVLILHRFCAEFTPHQHQVDAVCGNTAIDGCWRPWKLQLETAQWMNRFFWEPSVAVVAIAAAIAAKARNQGFCLCRSSVHKIASLIHAGLLPVV